MIFYLPGLDFTVACTVLLTAYPVACIEIPLEWFQNVFSVDGDTYTVSPQPEAFYTLNLALASLLPEAGGSGALVAGTAYVYHDALRYLAQLLLGAPDESFFSNAIAIRADLVSKSGVEYIRPILTPGTSTDDGVGNICREINRQMPDSRKQTSGPIVFEEDDVFCFKYTVNFEQAPTGRNYTIKMVMKETPNPAFSAIPQGFFIFANS
jgi:hypothetical protein